MQMLYLRLSDCAQSILRRGCQRKCAESGEGSAIQGQHPSLYSIAPQECLSLTAIPPDIDR